jgi:hypothetical protein
MLWRIFALSKEPELLKIVKCHGHEPADQVLTNIFNRLLDIS